MFKFGRTSTLRLKTCHDKIQLIMADAIRTAPIDFGIVCGYRGKIKQDEAFYGAKSKAKWGKSKHNFRQGDTPCSLAVDIAPYSEKLRDYLWEDYEAYEVLYRHIVLVAHKFGVRIRWGGHFKSIKNDLGHFEIAI